jgi:hypothetical protein
MVEVLHVLQKDGFIKSNEESVTELINRNCEHYRNNKYVVVKRILCLIFLFIH